MARSFEHDLREPGAARAGALWPWALFAAALFAGIAAFFIYTPR